MRARNLTSALAVVAVISALLVVQTPPPASALSPGVDFSAEDLSTWQTNGTVWGIDAANGKVVAGGTFSQVRPPTGQPGTPLSQNALVILDGETGAPDQCQFSMGLSGGTPTVRAVQASADGSVVYIGGNFSNVGGVNVARIAALNIVNCTVLPFRAPLPGSTVTALDVHENTLYAGGLFNTVGSAERRAFAAFNATTGALLDWTANAVRTMTNLPPEVGQARAVQASPDGSKVVVGGDMFEINGVYSHSIAMVSGATGANGAGGDVLRTYAPGFIPNTSVTKVIVDGGDGRFYIGNEGTGGGVFDGKAAFSWDTGDQVWRDNCLGAVQDLLVRGGTIYSASHHHDCASINAFPDGIRRYFAAQSTETMEFFGWLPLGNDGNGEGIGPRGLTVVTGKTTGKEYIWSGGEFTRINGHEQQGLTRFGPDDTGAPPTPVISAEATSDGTIQVHFRTVVDSDDDQLTYSVYRTGTSAPIWQGTAKSLWWERPQATFVDTDVTAGTNYTYRVTASDGTNTSGQSAPSSARAIAPAEDYQSVVRGLSPEATWTGAAVGSWAIDSSANSARSNAVSGLLTDGASQAAGESAVGTNTTAFSFDGSNDYIRSEVLRPGPSTYTVSAWVKTTTNRGGKILGFGNGRPNTGTNTSRLSGSYDRHLYMANNGRVLFGVYTGSTVTLTSPTALNDGEWHYLVGTQGPGGMRLYVDGVPVASNGVTNAQDYWGIWRAGGDQLGSWPSSPSSNFLSGLIDEVAVYPTAIGRVDVSKLYQASGRQLDTNTVPTDQYGAAVFNEDPELYWRFDETSGAAEDSSLFAQRPGVYNSGTERGVAGVIDGNSAVRTSGTSEGTVATSETLSPAPVFTAETWFKTTTTSGGKIFGFENTQTGNGSSYDKHLYMTNDGRLVWGSYIGAPAVVTSDDSYNDGVWHHVATVIDNFGRKLFVDGEQVAQNNVTGAENGVGYWRVGGGNIGGWPDQSSSSYFNGVIDEFAVYAQSMPAATIAAHYALGVADASAPSAPSDVEATAVDNGVALSWAAAESGFGVQEYRIYRGADAAFPISEDALIGTTAELTFADDSVAPGVAYYRVVAVGPGEKVGSPSDAIEITVPDTTAPSVPGDLVAVVDQASVNLSWTASTDDVGVATYEVHRADTDDFTPSAGTRIAAVTETSYVDTDRPAATAYYRIVAMDAADNASDASQAVEAIVPDVTAPTTPTGVTAVTGGDPEIALTWTASDDDLAVTGYDVYRGSSADFAVTDETKIARVVSPSYTDTALTPGTWYYRIVAVDAGGNSSPPSEVASAAIADVTAPTAPTDLAGSASGNDVALTWAAASDDVAVAHYDIHRGSSSDFAPSAETKVGESTSLSYTDADRPAGAVFYRVIAVDATGNAGAASESAEVSVSDVTPPTAPTVTALLSGGAVNVSWSESSDDVAVTGYEVHRGQSPDFSVTEATKIADATGMSYIDESATAGSWYYRVVAVDAAGNGAPSGAVEVVIPDTTAPAAPAGLAAAAAGGNVQLSWTASSDDVAVAGYEVHRSATAGFTPSEATRVGTSTEASFTDVDVAPGTWYYTIIAADAAGNVSAASNEAAVEVLDIDETPPSTPSDLASAVEGANVSLTWTAAGDDVGVVGYQVHRGSTADFQPTPGSLLATVSETTYLDSGRPAGAWFYRVIATDAAGNASDPSSAVEAVVADASGPSAPTDVTASMSGVNATVSWSASTDDVGVTGYRLYRGATADFEVSAELMVAEVTELSATEESIPAGTWFYRVVAVDGAGNFSLPSDAVQATVADTSAPSVVTGVAALPVASGVAVSWLPATDDVAVTAYQVFRGTDAGFAPSAENQIAEVTDASYLDAAASGTWFYKVAAVDAAGNVGQASDAAQATVTDATAPSVPSGVGAVVAGSSVVVSWSASSDDVGVVGYQVHRGSSAGFAVSGASKVADVTSTSFSDAGRPVGTWYYRVVAVDAAGNASAASAEVSGAVTGSGEPVTVTVPVVEDAMVFGIIPGTNFGSDTQLSSRGGTSSPIQSFLSFDLPDAPAGMMLTGAEMRVRTSTDPTGTSADLHVLHLMSGAWSESALTWTNRPTTEGAVLGSLGAAPATNTAYTASVSANALAGVLGTQQTLRISSSGADSLRLWSSEAANTSYRPTLVLTFTPGSGPVEDVVAPSVPSGVGAVVAGSSVVVSWSASSDDVGVVGYQVHRGSSAGFAVSGASKVADVTSTSFSDAGRPVGTWYYRVVAVDAAGNASAASAEVSGAVTGSGEPVTVTVPVVEDAMVFGIIPGTNFGSDTQLSSRGGTSSPIQSFLSFDLPDAPAGMMLTGAEMRVRTSTDPTGTSADLHVLHLMSGAWSESALTWTNRPTTEGAVLGSLGAAPATNTAYTASVSANALAGVLGTQQTLRISSSGADSLRLWSSEAVNTSYRPTLVLTFTPVQ